MRDAYNKDLVVYDTMQKCLHLNMEPEAMLSSVGEACFKAYHHYRDLFIQRELVSTSGFVPFPITGNSV